MKDYNDEYIDSKNDPFSVEEVTEEDYTVLEDEEEIEFDKVYESIRSNIIDFSEYDKMMEKKVAAYLGKKLNE